MLHQSGTRSRVMGATRVDRADPGGNDLTCQTGTHTFPNLTFSKNLEESVSYFQVDMRTSGQSHPTDQIGPPWAETQGTRICCY